MYEEVSAAPAASLWPLWLWWSFLTAILAAEVGKMSNSVALAGMVLIMGMYVVARVMFLEVLIAGGYVTPRTVRNFSQSTAVVGLTLAVLVSILLYKQLSMLQLLLLLAALVVVVRPSVTWRVIRRIRTST